MNTETFNKHLELLQKLEKEILSDKADSYAHGDRLSNFYDSGELNRVSPYRALWGMVTKHIIALKDYINNERVHEIDPGEVFEKLGDIRNYMYLLSAICYDMNSDYKEYFDERTEHLHTMQAAPSTQPRSKRGGKI